MVSKLKSMKLNVSDEMLVVMILNSLRYKFGHFFMSYNCQRKIDNKRAHFTLYSRGGKIKE
jgi:hypothetical protein